MCSGWGGGGRCVVGIGIVLSCVLGFGGMEVQSFMALVRT